MTHVGHAVNVFDLAPRGRSLRDLAFVLRADDLIGSRAGQDREAERPRVVAVELGNPSIERRARRATASPRGARCSSSPTLTMRSLPVSAYRMMASM